MGATWIVLGAFFADWLLVDDTSLLIISRKEEYVWKGHKGGRGGNPDTLYWKLFYLLNRLPAWIRPNTSISERHLGNEDNGSVIDGESTNADVGAGGRRQAVMCDEFSRVNPSDADTIQMTLSDTTPARIFNSTPTTKGHPFGALRFSGKVPIITMGWWEHPWKKRGLYRSPDLNQIIFLDLDYYRQQQPEVFNELSVNTPYIYSELQKHLITSSVDEDQYDKMWNLSFIADGENKLRSPWYDREEARRTKRDMAVNVDINYVGAGDLVFTCDLQRMVADAKKPDLAGEIIYDVRDYAIRNVRFEVRGKRRFKWWGPLAGRRPNQIHNYIIGCDISLGTGTSNSVATIYDCNTQSKCGTFVCPNTTPTAFAEQVYAIGFWVGGVTQMPFLIFEGNGPGQTFDKRLYEIGYDFVYRTREEKKVTRKRKKTRGWYSNTDTKVNLLIAYDAALHARYNPSTQELAYNNPDELSLREAEGYIYYPNGTPGPDSSQTDEGGARAAHGDRVIADALTCLARADQRKAPPSSLMPSPYGTFLHRRQQRVIAARKEKEESRWLL